MVLDAPHWDMYAKGSITGLSRGTNKNHIVRAALEGICYQVRDVFEAMKKDSGITLKELKVDGGASANNWMMQFQSDQLQISVIRPEYLESTVKGAAMLAGIGAKLFTIKDLQNIKSGTTIFSPKMELEEADRLYLEWSETVGRIG